MKRFLLLTCAGTLCALALLTIYCTERPFDNPLDEKEAGKNKDSWLWRIDPAVCNAMPGIPAGVDCPNYVRNCYFNNDCNIDPDTKNRWKVTLGGCADEEKLKITVVGDNPVTLTDDQQSEYSKLMGASGTQWQGVVTYSDGANIKAVLTTNGSGTDVYQGDQSKIPPVREAPYTIRYIATKPKCENPSQFDSTYETRTLKIEPYTEDDPVPPKITFTCQTEYTAATGLMYNDASCASVGARTEFTRTPQRGTPFDISKSGSYPVSYRACKDVTVNNNTTNQCVTLDTVIIVKEPSSGTYPTPVIVFSKYSYSVDGNAFSSPDTAFLVGGTFREPGQGNISAYYMKDGVKNTINVTGGNLTVSTSNIPTSLPSSLIPEGYVVNYTLAAVSGTYSEGKGTRKVYITGSGVCEGTLDMSFRFRTLSGGQIQGADNSLTIPPNTPWSNYQSSFNVSGIDIVDGIPFDIIGYKMGLYSSGTPKLDVDNPQPGTYTIKYVGLTECSNSGGQLRFFTSAERTVTVNP
jgi:hypothetical protein